MPSDKSTLKQQLAWLCGELIQCIENGDDGFPDLIAPAAEAARNLGYEDPPIQVILLHRGDDQPWHLLVRPADDLWRSHPEWCFAEVIRVVGPVGAMADYIVDARVKNDDQGPRAPATKSVEVDCADALRSIVRVLTQWQRWATAPDFDASGPPADVTPKAIPQKRRRRTVRKQLTTKQTEAVQLYGECKGNVAQVGRSMGIDPKTARGHLDAAMGKLGSHVFKATTGALPLDARGAVDVAGKDEGPAPTRGGRAIERDGRQ